MSREWHQRPSFDTSTKKKGVKAREGQALYQSSWWKGTRSMWIRRHPLCVQCEEAGRIEAATEVDHIKPHRGDINLFRNLANLQSLCSSCHARKTAGETRAVAAIPNVQKPSCRVVLVAGPVGSGKSSWVQANSNPSDLILDLDVMLMELCGVTLHTKATPEQIRMAMIERNRLLAQLSFKPRTTWLIATAPTWSERRRWQEVLGCELVVMGTSLEQCLENMSARDPSIDWESIAKKWFSCYSSGIGETIVRFGSWNHKNFPGGSEKILR